LKLKKQYYCLISYAIKKTIPALRVDFRVKGHYFIENSIISTGYNNIMKPHIITIVGKSNSGKTTLLEKLIACLREKGYRTGTVKHAHDGFEMDKKRPKEVVTTHVNADFDALSSMLAAKKLYPEAELVFPGSQEKGIRNFFLHSASYVFNFLRLKEI